MKKKYRLRQRLPISKKWSMTEAELKKKIYSTAGFYQCLYASSAMFITLLLWIVLSGFFALGLYMELKILIILISLLFLFPIIQVTSTPQIFLCRFRLLSETKSQQQ